VNQRPYLSIVTPVYGCEPSLHDLYWRLCSSITPITRSFEIIMVNDRSPDHAWETIRELAREDERVRGVNLSRNLVVRQFGRMCIRMVRFCRFADALRMLG